jgi:hypothetical protein
LRDGYRQAIIRRVQNRPVPRSQGSGGRRLAQAPYKGLGIRDYLHWRESNLLPAVRHRNKDCGSWFKDGLASQVLVLFMSANIQESTDYNCYE